jgi:hypothetical protein
MSNSSSSSKSKSKRGPPKERKPLIKRKHEDEKSDNKKIKLAEVEELTNQQLIENCSHKSKNVPSYSNARSTNLNPVITDSPDVSLIITYSFIYSFIHSFFFVFHSWLL